MSKRLVRTGAILEIHVMSKCLDLLGQLPPASRKAVMHWLVMRETNEVPHEVPGDQIDFLGKA
jgi:hypothetical protein